jgi:hypothetical protein
MLDLSFLKMNEIGSCLILQILQFSFSNIFLALFSFSCLSALKPVCLSLSLSLSPFIRTSKINLGRAVAQAVSRWLPTEAARVRVRAEHVGYAVDNAILGQVFSPEYFGFPC